MSHRHILLYDLRFGESTVELRQCINLEYATCYLCTSKHAIKSQCAVVVTTYDLASKNIDQIFRSEFDEFFENIWNRLEITSVGQS